MSVFDVSLIYVRVLLQRIWHTSSVDPRAVGDRLGIFEQDPAKPTKTGFY
jgi:hypothetical protein